MSKSKLNRRQLKKIRKRIKRALLSNGVSEFSYRCSNTESFSLKDLSSALLLCKFPNYQTDENVNERLLEEFRITFPMSVVSQINYILSKWYEGGGYV